MYRRLILALAATIGMTILASAAGAAGLLSATGDVIAILGGELYVGKAVGHLDGAGTLAIHSQKDPLRTCTGEFTSSAKLGGSGRLECSDGATATFQFQRLNIFRGYGAGSFSRGPMTFAYGLKHEEALPYLKLPEGKTLIHNGTELAMVDF